MSRVRAVLLLSALVCAAGWAIDVPLEYERYPEEQHAFQPHGFCFAAAEANAPDNATLPEFKSEQPLFAYVDLGNAKRLIVFDGDGTSQQYTRVFVDRDADGDLAEEAAVECQGNGDANYFYVQSKPVDLVLAINGKDTPYACSFTANGWKGNPDEKQFKPENMRIYIRPMCCLHGSLDLNGARYTLYLGDGNANGVFGDATTIQLPEKADEELRQVGSTGDHYYFTKEVEVTYTDAAPAARFVNIENLVYEASVDTAGRLMTLTPVTDGLVTAKLSMDVDVLSLVPAGEGDGVVLVNPEKNALVPKGAYRVAMYKASRTDEQGDTWTLSASVSTKGESVDVSKNTKIVFGEPFVPTVTVPGYVRQNMQMGQREAQLNFSIVGAGNELVTDLSHSKGTRTKIALDDSGTRPKKPQYKIVTNEGETVASGSFEYG